MTIDPTSLSEAVFSKIVESTDFEPQHDAQYLDPRLAEVYRQVGAVMSRYKSGKVPKAFKAIPTLKNWEEILTLTSPQDWTPNAMLEATMIFASNLPPKVVEKFYSDFLLSNLRKEFYSKKQISVHHFDALKKALFKPAAFFKGIIFTLCEDEFTTLKEANIYCGIITKNSIPVLHGAAALIKLCHGRYSGPKFMFIKSLLEKKFALPTKAVSAVFDYLCSFSQSTEAVPVLWQQALLLFVQRYKLELDDGKRDAIRKLLEIHPHPTISSEVLRELDVMQVE